MPVDQTGETILFAYDGDFIEAHVQIEYDGGDAEQFAWLVPVPQIPDIEVGSWRLVQAALDGTRPVYGFRTTAACFDNDDGSDSGLSFISNPDGGGASGGGGSGPDVVAQSVVGAFEYAVLQGGSAQTVNAWLLDNGYATDEDAPEILDTYIAEGSVFVAFRLRHGAEVEDIHPVVIRYQGDEPCIPLRLTRVAAKDDMDIRALFLGDHRVVPTSYRHVRLNRARLDWVQRGANYRTLVSNAVDAPGADGRAFVTEYAGTSAMIDPSALDTESYDSAVFIDMSPVDVAAELLNQGLLYCGPVDGEAEEVCLYQHELVSSLLHEFVPVPAGVSEGEFYGCLSCYAQLIDTDAWDGPAFAAAFQERVIDPLDHGRELLEMWPYVTRLYTTISPHEMIADPMFAELEGLPDVPSRHGAQRTLECCGDVMQLPGGRQITLSSGGGWPSWSDQMPWAERIEEYTPAGGAPVELTNHTNLIDDLIATWNAGSACSEEMDTGPVDSGGEGPTTLGTTGSSGSATSGAANDGGGDGCACTSAPGRDGPWSLALLGLALGAVRRRRA